MILINGSVWSRNKEDYVSISTESGIEEPYVQVRVSGPSGSAAVFVDRYELLRTIQAIVDSEGNMS